MSRDAVAPDWLTATPIAHRGLHARRLGRVENSLAAAAAAIEMAYAIECDVQISQDGEAVVFHDETLQRLTAREGRLSDLPAQEITAIPYRDGTGTIPRFSQLLAMIAGRVPLLVEIKSRFDGDMRLAERTVELIADYRGPLAVQSFDPGILVHLRQRALGRPLGLIAQADYAEAEWSGLTDAARTALVSFADYPQTRPDFLAWNIGDLPHATAMLWRNGLNLPLLTWTVRTPAQAAIAAANADQIIFENFDPSSVNLPA